MADITADADDVRYLTAMFAFAVRSFGAGMVSVPGFERAVEACSRLAVAAEQPQMPEDPVGAVKSSAIIWHQMLLEFREAGFDDHEAFELVKIQVSALTQLGLMRSIHG